jgi:hypothetical protein
MLNMNLNQKKIKFSQLSGDKIASNIARDCESFFSDSTSGKIEKKFLIKIRVYPRLSAAKFSFGCATFIKIKYTPNPIAKVTNHA